MDRINKYVEQVTTDTDVVWYLRDCVYAVGQCRICAPTVKQFAVQTLMSAAFHVAALTGRIHARN